MSQWSHLYKTWSWKKRRERQLSAEPLCRYCRERGRFTVATVADHIVQHNGDMEKFNGPLQSLCSRCHSAVKAKEEGRGGKAGHVVGADRAGVPLDPSHHWRQEAIK